MISASVVGLYFWAYFSNNPEISAPFIVSLPAVIIAGVTAFISFVSYIWVPPKIIFPISVIIYLTLASTIALLVISTGNLSSPFIAIWMLISVFAFVFGLRTSIPILLSTIAFGVNLYIIDKDITIETIIIFISSGLLPLLASIIIWHSKSGKDESGAGDKTYHNLKDKLNEVTTKSEIVINAIGDGVIALDNQGVIQLINPAAQSIIGWSGQDAISLNYKSVLKLVDKKEEPLVIDKDPIQQVLNLNQQIRTNDLALLTNSSKKINISLVVSPVGEVGSGAIAVFHDITKEKTEEYEQAEFISTASHEMRTPVASIEGYLGLALNPVTAQIDARARDFIMKAHDSAEHLGHLFQDLLDVSKAEDGRLANNPQVVDIVAFTHEIIQGLEEKATEKGIKLIFQPMPTGDSEKHIAPVYYLNLDNDHIREILENLIENAIKYTPKGEVSIDIVGDEDHVVISVKDSGIGIPAEDIPHLFQKFYRIDNKDTRDIGGTGLGLYLCRRLSEALGGRIWVESEEGIGSTFYVDLPRISTQEAILLNEQVVLRAKEEARQAVAPATAVAPPEPAPIKQVMDIIKPATTVPRSQSLTPEQIKAFIAQQRALALQNPKPTLTIPTTPVYSRPKNIIIPARQPRQ